MDAFHNNWFCRYPRPMQGTFDNGSGFKCVFKKMCDNLGIKCRLTTSYNPQGNSIIERIHHVLGNMLRAFELEERELDPDDILKLIQSILILWFCHRSYLVLGCFSFDLWEFGRFMLLHI
jgi:hypothetical protein